jgi:hypothetical protein
MKRFLGYALILGSLSIPAFAGKNTETVNLAQDVKVGTTQLAAGDYKVTWTGTGSAVQVTLVQKGKAPVTVAAKIVDAKNGHVGVVTDSANGTTVLQSIELNKFNLVLTGATAQGE